MAHKESWKHFAARVRTIIDVDFCCIPKGGVLDLAGNRTICRRGSTFVVRVAKPVVERENDLDGGYTYEAHDYPDHFRVVTLS